jgi:hypothetical protein
VVQTLQGQVLFRNPWCFGTDAFHAHVSPWRFWTESASRQQRAFYVRMVTDFAAARNGVIR